MFDPEIRSLPSGPLAWPALFGRVAPIELELGIGKARFLGRAARQQPEHDFLGLERAPKWLAEGKRRLMKDCPPNLRVLLAEALDFLAQRVPAGSVRILHVYHSDPWPKRRHRKRRLIGARFLSEARRVLEPGGELRITTDHWDYAREIASLLAACAELTPLPWPGLEEPDTHYEVKFRLQGQAIHRFRLRAPGEA
jgi:tRNA (guanine-N7-)-methyltransferase